MRTQADFNATFLLHSLKEDPIERDAPLAEEITQMLFGRFNWIAKNVTVNVIPQYRRRRRGGLHFIQHTQPFKDAQGRRAKEMRGERVAGEMRFLQ